MSEDVSEDAEENINAESVLLDLQIGESGVRETVRRRFLDWKI